MNATTVVVEHIRPAVVVHFAGFVELCKPRIAMMVLVAVAVAYCVGSWGQPQPMRLVHVLLGTLLVAASASTFNQWLERELDQLMLRTAGRPLPAGRVTPWAALAFGSVMFAAGELYLAAFLGIAPMVWALMTWVLYVWVYTPAKTRTSANTAIGAIAGALPVMIGWSAAQGNYDLRAAAIFLLLFLWQFPHFMAIAWLYREQYGRAGMKMLSVVEPTGARAGIQAVWAALALVPVSIVPALFAPGLGALAYAVLTLLLGLAQLAFAIQFCAWRSDDAARNLLRASLVYLPTVLMLLLLVPWM